jgi:hypothetical protein
MHVVGHVTLHVNVCLKIPQKRFFMYFFLDFLNGKPEVTNSWVLVRRV